MLEAMLEVLVVGLVVLFFIVVIVQEVSKHRYYVKHQKAQADAYATAMREYYKECLKDSWADLKKSWTQWRGKKLTP